MYPHAKAAKSRAHRLLDAFFGPIEPVEPAGSFREVYVEITGDRGLTGRNKDVDRLIYREALDTNSFANVLGDAISRRMVAEYNTPNRYGIWKNLATIARADDFRTKQVVRYGGYGDLPIVAEGDPYLAAASPTDEKSSYAIAKHGGTESVTLEMIKNDDIQAIRAIPKKLAQAAQRTLAHFVLNFLRDNPSIYDGKALFHVDHGNLVNLTLSASGMAAVRNSMKKQTELGSGDPLGLAPRYLWVPVDLEETAINLFLRGSNQDKTFVQNLNLQVVPVWYWSDMDDWCVSADPADCPTVEIGFLNGAEEPELFLQDAPMAGSLFSNDQLTYKIRHIYGGAVTDYRGVYKSVVA